MQPLPKEPAVSYHALEKAARVLRPFVRIYFPFHGLSDADFMHYFPLLVTVESSVYQIDEGYEKNITADEFDPRPMDMLVDYLDRKDLLDAAITEELENALHYYRLEHAMCGGKAFSHEDVLLASRFRCYDIRVLHRLLYRVREQPYNEEILEVFRIGEVLGELEDDIRSYKEDSSRNVFNTYSMLVRLHGAEGKAQFQGFLDDLDAQLQAQRVNFPKLVALWETYRAKSPAPDLPEPILPGTTR